MQQIQNVSRLRMFKIVYHLVFLAVVFFDINGKAIGDGKPVSHSVNFIVFINEYESNFICSMKLFIWLLIKLVQPMNVNLHLRINFKIYLS